MKEVWTLNKLTSFTHPIFLIEYLTQNGAIICVGLGSICYVSGLDLCLETYVLKKLNSKIQVMFIINITWYETWNNQVLPFASLLC